MEEDFKMIPKPRLAALLLPASLAAMLAALAIAAVGLGIAVPANGEEPVDPALADRFEYLSTNGNSNCSREFLQSIAGMPPVARLRGSCCSPKPDEPASLHRASCGTEEVRRLR
jgi:hypothetical protein